VEDNLEERVKPSKSSISRRSFLGKSLAVGHMKRLQVNLFSCVVAAVLIPLLLAPAVAQATPWTVVMSPNPGAGNGLFGATIISASDIWAVGAFFNTTTNATQTLIEQWDGASWTVVTSPNPSSTTNLLEAVAADKSSGQAWAVGEFSAPTTIDTLIEFNPSAGD
jgi:hypothetical protein